MGFFYLVETDCQYHILPKILLLRILFTIIIVDGVTMIQ